MTRYNAKAGLPAAANDRGQRGWKLPEPAAGLTGFGLEALRDVIHGFVPVGALENVVLSWAEYRQLGNDAALQKNLATRVQGRVYPTAMHPQLMVEGEVMLIYLLNNVYICVSDDLGPRPRQQEAWDEAAQREKRRGTIEMVR